MPPYKQLSWIELRDFTKGLYEYDPFLLAPGAAASMVDCYPMPQGGLRAWYKKLNTLTTTGISSIANERITGLFVRGDIALRVGAGRASDRYLTTFSASDSKYRLYRMDETNGNSTWNLIKTSAASTNTHSALNQFRYFIDSSGVEYVICTFGNGSTDEGLYSIKYSDGTITKITTFVGPFTTHEARIVIAEASGSHPDRIWWTDPGTLTIPADNFLDVEPNQPASLIRLLRASAPGDLLVGKLGAPWVTIQGDIENPTVYQMSGGAPCGAAISDAVVVPEGVAFIEYRRHLWLTTSGNSFANLSPQLTPFTPLNNVSDTAGKPDFYDRWLFAPRGLVLDWDTKAWFHASDINGTGAWYAVDAYAARMMVGTAGGSFSLFEYYLDEDAVRQRTYSWQSGPLRSPDGRQLEVREVQVVLDVLGSGASVTITVGGVAQTLTTLAAGRQTLRFLMVARDEMLDVTLAVDSGSDSIEAPIIESLRIGWRDGHLTAAQA